MKMNWAYAACQLIGWSLYGAVMVSLLAANPTMSWRMAFLAGASGAVTGFIASHGLRTAWKRFHWGQLKLLALLPRVLGSSVLAAAVTQAIAFALSVFVFELFTLAQSSMFFFVFYVLQSTALFMLWQVIYGGVHAVQRSSRAERERQQSLALANASELRALRAQLNPHFLFNALNTVRALIDEDPTRAQEAVTRLSTLLRYTLAASENARVPLERELEVVGDYLALESLRFEDRLRTTLDVPPECQGVQVPVMVLQTLVENAVKHGIARRIDGGVITVTARKTEGSLILCVTNPSPRTAAKSDGTNVGVGNTTERLRLLYGDAACFSLDAGDALFTATVVIPCT